MKMLLLISNTFWRSTTLSLSRTSLEILYYFTFPILTLGEAKQWFYANMEKNNMWALCSTNFLAKFFPIGKTNALRAKISSFQQQHDETVQKLGSAFKTAYSSVLIMGWRIGCSCRHSITGSATTLVKRWMLPLEEHSYHLLSLKSLLLWNRWPPIMGGVKKELRPAREVEECTSSRR